LSKKIYAAAVHSFKNGSYDSSIAGFRKALSLNPPGDLVDKMRFGIGCAYFKMKKYRQAVADLDFIVSKIPNSDKWFISSALLGWIYDDLGEKSKAIFVLENAMQKNPSEFILPMLNRLMQMVQEAPTTAKETIDPQAPKKE
jgi:TolA-binding protein